MDNLDIGLAITVVGMGGTILGLYLIVCMVGVIKRFLPYREGEDMGAGKAGI
ncbi:MAG: OadG-related small transporter subunit [Syntrophobacteraceae bacterium]